MSLSSAYFMVGTSSLSVIGLTWRISEGLQVPPADIAFLVTVFALTFAVAAPMTQVLFSHIVRVKVLAIGLTVLAIGLVMGAFSVNYTMLFFSRALMGLGAAAVSPVCSAIGAGLAAPEHQGRAIGIVFAGLTIASVLGTPLSAYLGTLIDWRMVMLLLAVLALLSMSAVLYFVKDRNAGAPIRFFHLVEALIRPRTAFAILLTFLQMTSIFCTYALIAPFMHEKFALGENLLAVVMLTYGINGVIGNVVAGRLSDRLGANKIILISLVGIGSGFFGLWLVGPQLWLGFVMLASWSFFGMMFHSPQQQRLANIDPDRRGLLLALNAGSLYLGISIGSGVSNFVSVHFGFLVLPLVSTGVLISCLAVFWMSVYAMKKAA